MQTEELVQNEKHSDEQKPRKLASAARRSFLEKAGGLGAVALASTLVPLEPLLGGKESQAEASVIGYDETTRSGASYGYRTNTATAENINIGTLPDNGDATRFTDYSGSWSKCLLHDHIGIVNGNAWSSFVTALSTGKFSDFENIVVGNPGGTNFTATLNGPQGALAFDLEGLDSHATNIPPAPSVTTAQTARRRGRALLGRTDARYPVRRIHQHQIQRQLRCSGLR